MKSMAGRIEMVRIGIVGFGGMGQVHFMNYKKIKDCQVVATVNNSEPGKHKAEEFGLAYYEDIKKMVENEDIDVIDICTPTFLHKQHVMESLNFGKHVIVEKPIALHKEDAIEMYALAREKNCLLFVAYVLQFTKEIEILHDAVKSGKYGKPLDGFFERISGRPGWSQNGWLFDKEKSGLIPFDLHIHDLDIIVSLFGEPEGYEYTSSGGKERDFKEQYRLTYKFKDLYVVAEAAWYNADFPFTARWRIYFENGLLVNDGKNVILYQKDKEPYVYDTKEEVLVSTGINLPPTGMFYNELSHFISCIEKGNSSEKVSKQQVLTGIGILEEITFGAGLKS